MLMTLLIGVSIAFFLTGVVLAAMVHRIRKHETEIEDLKNKVDIHDIVIMEADEDPLKNWPEKDKA